jgi:hypothetical protein
MSEWIKEVWEIYQLICESPIPPIELYRKVSFAHKYDHVTLHNQIIRYVSVLQGNGFIKIPRPMDWDKEYHGYTFKPRGHWTMYVAKMITWKEFRNKLVESYW